jgi:carbamoylphosphate synthase large subunit
MKIGIVAGKSSEMLTKELQHRGHQVFLLCGKASDPGYNIANKSIDLYFTLENSSENVYKAVDFFLRNTIDAFILGTGTWFAFDIAEELQNKGVHISHNIEISKIFKDKVLTKELFLKYNLNTPSYNSYKTLNIETIDLIEFPNVIKSNIDLFPVFYCKDRSRILQLMKEVEQDKLDKGILIEECIEGNDITIPLAATKGSIKALDVIYWSKQHNYKLEGFNDLLEIRLSKEKEKELLIICEEFIKKVGYYGLCRFDLRITRTDYYFLEVNSVISIRNEGSSYQSMIDKGIKLEKIATDTYLENIK